MQLLKPLQKRQRLARLSRIKKSRARRDAEGRLTCMNCGAILGGPFCHVCGQRDGDVRLPIWSMLAEILDDVFSADSRIIKSLIMLIVVPGGLTRSFMSGQRARYVMPMKLYLAVSVLFFLILSVSNVAIFDLAVVPKAATSADGAVTQDGEVAAETSTHRGSADETVQPQEQPSTPVDQRSPESGGSAAGSVPAPPALEVTLSDEDYATIMAEVPDNLRDALAGVEEAERRQALRIYNRMLTEAGDAGPQNLVRQAMGTAIIRNLGNLAAMEDALLDDDGKDLNINFGDTDLSFAGIQFGNYDISVGAFVPIDRDVKRGFTEEDAAAFIANNRADGTDEALLQNIVRILERPDAFNELFNDWLPIALFGLMPLFALMLRVTHWGGRRVYLHQLVFSLHFHSFLFLLMLMFIAFAGQWDGPTMGLVFWGGSSLYLIIALKVGQNQGWIRAVLKAGFLWVGYVFFLTSVLTGAIVYGITTM